MSGWIAGAIVVGAVVNYQAQKKSGEAQQEGIREGMKIEERIAQRQLEELQRQYNLMREDFAPFRETGLMADEQIRNILSGDISGFQESPGYQYRLREGEKAVRRAASAEGFLNTGQQKLALQRAGQREASREYQNYLNTLLVASGRGQAATGSVAGAGSQYAGNVTNVLAGLGAAQGQAALLGGQARASTYQGYGNIASNALNQYMMYRGYRDGQGGGSYYGASQTSGYGSNVQGDAYAPAYGG